MRSGGLNYPDVAAQIRLPVYAHNAPRNVQSTSDHPPWPSPPPLLPPPASLSRPEEEVGTYVPTYAVCVLRGWAHIDRYVPPVAR